MAKTKLIDKLGEISEVLANDVRRFCEQYNVRLTNVFISSESGIAGELMYNFSGKKMCGGYTLNGIRKSLL